MSDDVGPLSVSLDPRAQALIRDGRTLFAQGDVERARQCFAAAVAIEPDDAAARAGLDRCRRLLAEGLQRAEPSRSMPIEGRSTVEIRGPIDLRPELPLGDADDGHEATVVDPPAQRLIDAELARARDAGGASPRADAARAAPDGDNDGADDGDAGPDDQTRVEHDPVELAGHDVGAAPVSRSGLAGAGAPGDGYGEEQARGPFGGDAARGDHDGGEPPRRQFRGEDPRGGHDGGEPSRRQFRGEVPRGDHDDGELPRAFESNGTRGAGGTPRDPYDPNGRGFRVDGPGARRRPGAPHGPGSRRGPGAPYGPASSHPVPAAPAGGFPSPDYPGADPMGSQGYPTGPDAGHASSRFPAMPVARPGRSGRFWLIVAAIVSAAAGIAILVGYAASGSNDGGGAGSAAAISAGAGGVKADGSGSTAAAAGTPGPGAATDPDASGVPALSAALAPGAAEVRVGRIEHPVVAVVVASTDGAVERIHVKAGGSVTTGQKLYSLRAGKGVRSSEAIVSSPAAGRIERRAARGDRVARGDVLAQLVDPDQWLVIADLRSDQVTTGWSCTIATAEGRNRAPCRVESVQRLSGERSLATVTVATAQAGWLQGGVQPLLLRLIPPGGAPEEPTTPTEGSTATGGSSKAAGGASGPTGSPAKDAASPSADGRGPDAGR